MSETATGGQHDSGRYEICLQGHLDPRWAAWFEGLTIAHASNGTTVIHGQVADQAALHGLLQKTRDLGLPLISVNHFGPTERIPMSSTRKTALVAGVFYLITFVSIPTLALYGPVKNHRDWILGSGGHTAVLVGGFLEVIVALACIGTAVTLYPVIRRQNEGVALGFVAARVLEAGMIFTGVISLLSLLTLRQDLGGAAGANAAALVTTAASHVAIYKWTFLLGQSFMPGINALLLGSLLYRSRLVPRVIPMMGLIGAPLLIAAVFATLFGGIGQGSSWTALAAVPVAAWELSLGIWLVVKGFKSSPVTDGMVAASPPLAERGIAS